MQTHRLLVKKHGFLTLYLMTAKQMGLRKIVQELSDRFDLSVGYLKLSHLIQKTMLDLQSCESLLKEYYRFMADQEISTNEDCLFQKASVCGKEVWVSNYDAGRRFLLENRLRKSLNDSCV